MICPLCKNTETKTKLIAAQKVYRICNNCKLIFVENEFRLTPVEEKKRYSFHNNSIKNKDYVDFLNQLILPAKKHISPNSTALDYGCGPEPVLSQILSNEGITCNYYDPFFYPEINLYIKYDVLFASECFEHFFYPFKEIIKIIELLKPDGILAVMSEFWTEEKDLTNWYYMKDPTHVCFYHLDTFKNICKIFGFEILFTDKKRVIILKKSQQNP